jgi:hypothetical protein
MNYASLVAEIQGTAEYEEADFVAAIPEFVQRAENRIFRDIDLPAFKQTDTTTVTASNKFLSTPDGFQYAHYFSVNGRMLLPKQVDWIAEAYPTGHTAAAPIYYAQFDENSIIMGPTPNSGYSCELCYARIPESIVTAGTTWIGDNAGRALFYASMVEAAIYMRQDDNVIMAYEKSYQDSLAGLAIYGALRVKSDTFKERDKRPIEQ